jgi:hypothetical protein
MNSGESDENTQRFFSACGYPDARTRDTTMLASLAGTPQSKPRETTLPHVSIFVVRNVDAAVPSVTQISIGLC